MNLRLLRNGAIALIVGFAVIQLVPYGRDHVNPAVSQEPEWDSPVTRELASRACFDCHSNETKWPWYTQIAPVSWLTQHDVEDGRHHLNFSEWDKPQRDADEAAEAVEEGEMPLWFYVPLHPEAKLDDAETAQLIQGLKATTGSEATAKNEHAPD